MLTFERLAQTGTDRISLEPHALVIAGWAARDAAAVQHHIDELAALGVPPPSQVPLFYRAAASLLTQSEAVEFLGSDSSGEVEPVIVSLEDGLWLGIGSDHTDRKAEAHGVALSKQMCAKPIGRTLWRLDEVAGHWDSLVLRAYATVDGTRVLYQDGTLATMRTPDDLIARYGAGLAPGTIMFGGTLAAIGGVRPAGRFEMELHDPVLGRTMAHAYDCFTLPVIA